MKRKQYVHKIWYYTILLNKMIPALSADSKVKIGEALRHNKDFAKNVPAKFGSYDNAFNTLKEMIDRWQQEIQSRNRG